MTRINYGMGHDVDRKQTYRRKMKESRGHHVEFHPAKYILGHV